MLKFFKSDSQTISENQSTPKEPKTAIEPREQKPAVHLFKDEDLHISDGLTRRLNVEKLEWCLINGIDNKAVRAAVKEKERNDKIQNADNEFKAQRKILHQNLRLELSKYNLLRKDDAEIKKVKKSQKDLLRDEYRKKVDELAIKRNTIFAQAYGDKFFYDLMLDEDAIGWEWNLSGADSGCKICKNNVGKYKKGTGPNFPAHDGCTCLLNSVYKGEL